MGRTETMVAIAIGLLPLLLINATLVHGSAVPSTILPSPLTDQETFQPKDDVKGGVATTVSGGIGEFWLCPTLNETLERAKKWGFNTFRLAFGLSDDSFNKVVTTDALNQFKAVVSKIASYGYRIVLDLHNDDDHIGFIGSLQWYTRWSQFARQFVNDSRIVAFQLFNEPTPECMHYYLHGATEAESVRLFLTALVRVTDNIRSMGWNKPIVYPNPSYWRWYDIPPDLQRSNIVISHHIWSKKPYPTTVQEAQAQIDALSDPNSRAVQWAGRHPSYKHWFDETGVHYADTLERIDAEMYFAKEAINLGLKLKTGFIWWLYSRNHWLKGSADQVIASSNWNGLSTQA